MMIRMCNKNKRNIVRKNGLVPQTYADQTILKSILLDESAVGIATAARLRGRSSSPVGVKKFHFAMCGVHPTSYPMGTGSAFPGDKAAMA
jgi:hypothetical protein